MIEGSTTILTRMKQLSTSLLSVSASTFIVVEQRYVRSSADLINREYSKLAQAIALDDNFAIKWALRSIADMMKGLIDIGSNLPTTQPVIWQEAKSVANDAHHIELNTRQ